MTRKQHILSSISLIMALLVSGCGSVAEPTSSEVTSTIISETTAVISETSETSAIEAPITTVTTEAETFEGTDSTEETTSVTNVISSVKTFSTEETTSIAVVETPTITSETPVSSTTSSASEVTTSETTTAYIIPLEAVLTETTEDTKEAVVEDSLRVVLPVENIQQLPELPAGCEITSTTIALNYELGITESKMDMVSYLPMDKWPDENSVWSSPWDAFVGDPSLTYYGAYSPVIKKTLESYFKKNKLDTEYKVTDLSGSSVAELYDAIDDGHPVIVWATIKMKASKPGNSWFLEDGSKYTWIAGEHCLVLIGYDLEQDTVILSDPYDSRGTVEYPRETFEKRFEELFQQALIIEKK